MRESVQGYNALSVNSFGVIPKKEDWSYALLPVVPERYKRIMIVHVKAAESGMGALMKMMGELTSGAAARTMLYAKGATEDQAMAYLQPIVI